MLYRLSGSELPKITAAYSVIRKTVWQISDPFNIVILIKSGICIFEIDSEQFTVAAGDVIFIPAKTFYTRMPYNDCLCEMIYIHFDLGSGDIGTLEIDEMKNFILNRTKKTHFKETDFILTTKISVFQNKEISFFIDKAEYIIKLFSLKRYFENNAAVFEFCSFLSVLSEKTLDSMDCTATPKNAYPDSLKIALKYIRTHSTAAVSLDELCAESCVSKQLLIRYFNRFFGVSPLKFISEYRINCIKPFLTLYPNKSIKEICEEFGFEDQCYFSRFFKKHTGETPSEYRNRISSFDQNSHISAISNKE